METIREAAHEVQRPVFYAIGIIITGVSSDLHAAARGRPTVQADGLDGRLRAAGRADLRDADRARALELRFPQRTEEWHNPLMDFDDQRLPGRPSVGIRFTLLTVGVGAGALSRFGLSFGSGIIGSEFLPHLDEGAIWARGTLAPSTGPDRGRARDEAGTHHSVPRFRKSPRWFRQVGRPDDGTDTTGFFNTEYFVDLKPKDQWRPVFQQNKEELIAAMDRELEKIPGALWNFSQPIADNMEEAVSGVKGHWLSRFTATISRRSKQKGDEIVR